MDSFTKKLWQRGGKIINHVANDVQSYLDTSLLNKFVSFVVALPDNLINHTQYTDIDVLKNEYKIEAPVHQDLTKTPTIEQFMSTANAGYTITGIPHHMSAFKINGKQAAIVDEATGMSAKVWKTDKNQLIISFEGTTGGDNFVFNPVMMASQVVSDIVSANQAHPVCYDDALKFTQYIVHEAEKQGISTNDIFLTGQSLGGGEASYVAQQTGLAGVSFEAHGMLPSDTAKGNGSNFVSIETYGDPWGEYASDTMPNAPIVTTVYPGEKGEFNHYGKVVQLGDIKDQVRMEHAMSDWNSSVLGNVVDYVEGLGFFLLYHLPNAQARDMGIHVHPVSISADLISAQHGPIVPISQDNIQQVLDYVPIKQ